MGKYRTPHDSRYLKVVDMADGGKMGGFTRRGEFQATVRKQARKIRAKNAR